MDRVEVGKKPDLTGADPAPSNAPAEPSTLYSTPVDQFFRKRSSNSDAKLPAAECARATQRAKGNPDSSGNIAERRRVDMYRPSYADQDENNNHWQRRPIRNGSPSLGNGYRDQGSHNGDRRRSGTNRKSFETNRKNFKEEARGRTLSREDPSNRNLRGHQPSPRINNQPRIQKVIRGGHPRGISDVRARKDILANRISRGGANGNARPALEGRSKPASSNPLTSESFKNTPAKCPGNSHQAENEVPSVPEAMDPTLPKAPPNTGRKKKFTNATAQGYQQDLGNRCQGTMPALGNTAKPDTPGGAEASHTKPQAAPGDLNPVQLAAALRAKVGQDLKQKAIVALKEMQEVYGLTPTQIVGEGISERAVRRLLGGLTLDV